VGGIAGDALTDADRNVALGYSALGTDTLGSRSTALGYAALGSQNFTTATDSYNVGAGYNAGGAVTTGVQNTLIGGLAGDALTDADFNVAIGVVALSTDTQGSKSTAIGHSALEAQNFTTATDSHNTAVGNNTGKAITTGVKNTLVGSNAGDALADADHNTALGFGALSGDTAGSRSTAIGDSALVAQNLTTATDVYNTAVGYFAGGSVTTGTNNTLIGGLAGDAITDGTFNTFVGKDAGSAATTGDYNTFIGAGTIAGTGNFGAGSLVTTGSKNVILGGYNGNQEGYDIRTENNHIVLSDGDGNPRVLIDSSGAFQTAVSAHAYLRAESSTTANLTLRNSTSGADGVDFFQVRTSDNTAKLLIEPDGDVKNTNNSYGAISDSKLKENVADSASQWDDIKAVRVRKYSFISDNLDSPNQIGVIAQELEASGMSGLVSERTDTDDNGNDLGTTTKSVKYSILYMKALKALQEAMTKIEDLEARVATLESN
jgi:hypothetical protein